MRSLETPADTGVAVSAAAAASPAAALVSLTAAIGASASITPLRPMPRRVLDQRGTQCCVSCALASAMEVRQPLWATLSPVFHYHVTRFVNKGADAGGRLFPSAGFATLMTNGICDEADHTSVFDDGGVGAQPSPGAFKKASTQVLRGALLQSPVKPIAPGSRSADIRSHLQAGRPVIVIFRMPLDYPKPTFLNDQHEWLDPATPPVSAVNHCVLLVGFDDLRGSGSTRKGAVEVFDSQGAGAFAGGRWWMGYRVLDSRIVVEAFALQ